MARRNGRFCDGAEEAVGETMNEHTKPWAQKPLDEWDIVGMNHYHVAGQRFLFVAMTKGDRCIQTEGPDDKYLWNRLWHKATAAKVAS